MRPHQVSWKKKVLFSAAMTLAFFVTLETSLALVGITPITDTRDPFVGFSDQQPLMRAVKSESGETWIRTSPNKLNWFNDQSFPAVKSAKTKRVVCVGGSTTYGRPYWDATSYVGWLRELLPIVQPEIQWQVINAGGVSYASYRVAAVMEQLAAYDPDLFIVYCGQNEFLERRTYHRLFDRPFVQTDLQAALVRTKTWALADRLVSGFDSQTLPSPRVILSGEVDEMLNHTIGPTDYHRDEIWRADVVRHYELNLQRMVAIANLAGAEILFVTPASNEKDCSPFKSEPHTDEQKVAELQYQDGLRLFDEGRFADAYDSFRRAINEDVCPLRAIDPIVDAVAQVARQRDVPLVDFPSLLRQSCLQAHGHACLGKEYFLDHVHPDNETHRQLAMWILQELQNHGIVDNRSLPDHQVDRVARRIESQIDKPSAGVALRNLAKVLHWAGKFAEALPRAREAIEMLPDDTASMMVLADCLAQTGQHDAAIEQYERLFRVAPDHIVAYLPYGELLVRRGDHREARDFLVIAAAEEPKNPRATYFLGLAEQALGNIDLALKSLEQSYKSAPDFYPAVPVIASLHADQGDIDAAERWYELAVEADASDVDSRFRLGLIMMQQSRPDSAAHQFEAVLRLEPSHAAARDNLAIARQLN